MLTTVAGRGIHVELTLPVSAIPVFTAGEVDSLCLPLRPHETCQETVPCLGSSLPIIAFFMRLLQLGSSAFLGNTEGLLSFTSVSPPVLAIFFFPRLPLEVCLGWGRAHA